MLKKSLKPLRIAANASNFFKALAYSSKCLKLIKTLAYSSKCLEFPSNPRVYQRMLKISLKPLRIVANA